MAKHYQIDDALFYQIVEHWHDSGLSNEEKLSRSFQGLLDQVSIEMDKIDEVIGLKPTCQMGCAFCCYFPIIVTELEAKLIKQALNQLPRARYQQIYQQLLTYQSDYAEKLKEARALDFYQDRNFKKNYRKLDLPCPLLNLETNACMAYQVRPIPCRTYVNYMDPEICKSNRMPEETVSFEFLYQPYFEALNDFLQWLYQEGDTGNVEYPNDIYHEDYLINWLKPEYLDRVNEK
ncbi:YkgJ family cysteine cluster protein [Amphibacillus jilinensis]|uniref:YkgJ family cysteine cluster protein n=1 Tax=Amphibacillus jilinensis TaxID=1216008 RepID=UPI0002F147D6|nr:YkgJ family cysteine cluster protein [Amphibacillus jilinensis]